MKVFIDGSSGTTGLQLREKLEKMSTHKKLEMLVLSEEKRRDINARKEALNSCDVAFLCLPDDEAIKSVEMIENEKVIIFDSSTAHRTNKDWAYGFPELSSELKNKILRVK